MKAEQKRENQRTSRRQFIKAMAALSCLTGCGQLSPTVRHQPSAPPVSPSPKPPSQTANGQKASRVVKLRDPKVWQDDQLQPTHLRQMLDRAVVAVTQKSSAQEGWTSLFAPDERIAIKVNTIGTRVNASEIWTHPPLVSGLTQCLCDAGVTPENIIIFDRFTDELKGAGYPINRDGPGVRCFGTDKDYVDGWTICNEPVQLSRILLEVDALINVPVLKAHGITGLTYALKNHYGSFNRPQDFHEGEMLRRGMAELNGLSPIRDKTRLVVGDVLAFCTTPHPSWPYWKIDGRDDAILMSTDPVAIDSCALNLLCDRIAAGDGQFKEARALTEPWLKAAEKMGLGNDSSSAIDYFEQGG